MRSTEKQERNDTIAKNAEQAKRGDDLHYEKRNIRKEKVSTSTSSPRNEREKKETERSTQQKR